MTRPPLTDFADREPPPACTEIRCALPADHAGPCDKRVDPSVLLVPPDDLATWRELTNPARLGVGVPVDRQPTCTREDEALAREVGVPETLAQARALIDKPRFTPGQRVEVTLRWTEQEGRKRRQVEQVRLGTVEGYDAAAGRYAVRVPGWDALWQVRGKDVRDAMGEGRP